jgi:hypothetical protein
MSAPVLSNAIPSLRLVRNRSARVYLCGPIAKNDWSRELVPRLREAFGDDAHRWLSSLPNRVASA